MTQSTAQAGNTSTEGGEGSAAASPRTFTQEEVNKLLAKERRDTQAKYPDYDKYKAAFDEAEKQAAASKSELELANERAEKAEKEAAALKAEKERAGWIAAAAKETGVPEAALHGNTEEEVKACAESLKEYFTDPAAPVVDSGKPSNDEGGTGDPLRDAINGLL